ncbi:MAG: FAD-binding oxidoreductase [Thalassobaculum sp.]|uniref:NAD(P)/FAD-dependent oxidoreductase n=1 Tax=Thalassobaculum sp. TaxID=2022740 RepID=UPI0032ECA0CA
MPSSTAANAPGRALPASADVVVIGGGVAGVSTAYYLARAGVSVVLCEKGRIAGEQSSRNWGWVRKQGRDVRELPLMIESMRCWHQIVADLDEDIGFAVGGVTYLAETAKDLARHEAWLESARPFQLDSRMLSPAEVDAMLGRTDRRFLGALHTPSDARAEPAKAVPAIARAAEKLGAVVLERTAVRTVDREGGRIAGVVTEHGRIACRSVVLAGGVWSRPFLENIGLSLPQLAVKSSVQRTTPAPRLSESTFGGVSASIRPRQDGGYTIARSGASRFDVIPAAFTHFRAFTPVLRREWRNIKLRFGRPFFDALGQRSWREDQMSPFEATRTWDPEPDHALLDDVMRAARSLYPQLADARPVERWAGMIDVTPDEVPAFGPVDAIPGLFIATGLSGHGFGIGPGLGKAMAGMIRGEPAMMDLSSLRFSRFGEPGGVVAGEEA